MYAIRSYYEAHRIRRIRRPVRRFLVAPRALKQGRAPLGALPIAPEMAIVAVAGDEAVRAVEACAARGVKVAVVMASGFGEVGAEGRALRDRMLAAARAAGMRMIGPNCQGIANLASGTIASFSTMFHEIAPQDGPSYNFV